MRQLRQMDRVLPIRFSLFRLFSALTNTEFHDLDSRALHGRPGRPPAGPAQPTSAHLGGNRPRALHTFQIMETKGADYGSKEYKWDYADPVGPVAKRRRGTVGAYRCSVCGDSDDFDTLCWCGVFCSRCAVHHPPETHIASLHMTILLSIAEVGSLLNRAAQEEAPERPRRKTRQPQRLDPWQEERTREIAREAEASRIARRAARAERLRESKARRDRVRARKGKASE